MNTQIGGSLLKHLDPEAADMENELEWHKQTKKSYCTIIIGSRER